MGNRTISRYQSHMSVERIQVTAFAKVRQIHLSAKNKNDPNKPDECLYSVSRPLIRFAVFSKSCQPKSVKHSCVIHIQNPREANSRSSIILISHMCVFIYVFIYLCIYVVTKFSLNIPIPF